MRRPSRMLMGASGCAQTARLLACTLLFASMALGCASTRSADEAESRWEEVTGRAPVSTSTREPRSFEQEVARGDQLRDQGDEPQAVWHYLRSLQLDASSPVPRARVAYMHLVEDPARGQRIFEELIEAHPQLADAHMGRGLSLIAQNRLVRARGSLERALELDPEAVVALVALGLLCDQAGEHELAQRYYGAAIVIEPGRYEVRNNLGMSYLLTGAFEHAAEAIRDAVYIDPRDPALYNNLGVALGRMRLYEEALDNFRRTSDEADALNNLGLVCHVNGDYGLAITYYEQSLLIGPSERDVVLVNLEASEVAQLLELVLR